MATPKPDILTPQVEYIHNEIFKNGNTHAFAIANNGSGPVLAYLGRKCRIGIMAVNLVKDNQHVAISHRTPLPYYIALAQNESSQLISLVIRYGENLPLLLSCEEDLRLRGQIMAYSRDAHGKNQAVAHALFWPEFSSAYAYIKRRNSALLEGDAELCHHLLLCGAIIGSALEQAHEAGGAK